jgi:hypothetical protein
VQIKAQHLPRTLNQVSSESKRIDRAVAIQKKVHVPRRELERNFEIVLFGKVVQKKAKTYPSLLNRVSSTLKRN